MFTKLEDGNMFNKYLVSRAKEFICIQGNPHRSCKGYLEIPILREERTGTQKA